METAPPEAPRSRTFSYFLVAFAGVAVVLAGVIWVIVGHTATIEIVAKNDTKQIVVPLRVPSDTNKDFNASVTTTRYQLSQVYYPTGGQTIDGVAGGTVTIYNKTATSQALVKTTRLLTPSGILFRLTDKVVVPANGQAAASVYADKPGKDSQIGPSDFSIPGLPADKQSVIFAKSNEPMLGGVKTSAVLTQKDIDDAKKSYKAKVTDLYLASLPATGQQRAAFVYGGTAAVDKKVGDQASQFTVSGENSLVVVEYDQASVVTSIQKQLRSTVDLSSEKIVSADTAPQVVLSAYSPSTGVADLSVTQTVTVSIDPNSDSLAPINFFGKSRDEIERYLLGLNHVDRASVTFSPSWLPSAPKSPDKIKVVVKDM